MHEQVDRLFGVLSWLRHQQLDRTDNTHERMSHYERATKAEFFPMPPAIAPITAKRHLLGLGLHDQTLVFASPHVPLHPDEVSHYYEHQRALHQFRVRRVRAIGATRRATIYLHPWMAEGTGWLDLGVSALISRALACDVFNLEQVHHGRRRSASARFAGAHFFSADLARTVESVRQAVTDARALARYLESTGEYDEVGVVGVSLGGTVATICACLEPALSWCVAAVAHLDIPHAVRHAPIAAHSRKQLRDFGLPLDELDRLHHTLLSRWLEPLEPERLFLIAGRHDQCMRAEAVEEQLARWPGVRCTWVDGGHITSILRLGPPLAELRADIDELPARKQRARDDLSRVDLHTS